MLIDNLQAYWKFDESSGNASDSSGNGKTLTNTSVSYSTGKINNGAVFNGSAQLGNSSITVNSTSFTISAWVKESASAPSDIYSIVCQDKTGGSPFRVFQFAISSSNYFRFVRFNSSNGLLTSLSNAVALNDGAWHHLVATFDNTVGSVIYVDGVSKNYDSVTTNNNSGTTIPTYIGVSQGDGGSIGNYLTGSIDEVGIWSRALSPTEVTQLYNSGSGYSYPFEIGNISAIIRRRLI